jgi:dihydrofolate reductase
MIVAVDANWAIGNKGSLLVRIPADHKMFRNETIGKTVVLGRKTLETFPQKQPLSGRTNIILTRNPDYKAGDALIAHSLEELLGMLKDIPDEEIYIIGGSSVYDMMLPYCDTVHVTKIDHEYEADAYFPNLDESDEWGIEADSDEQVYFDLTYRFLKYRRLNKAKSLI